jgi:hypothetical protein
MIVCVWNESAVTDWPVLEMKCRPGAYCDDQQIVIRFPTGARNISLLRSVRTTLGLTKPPIQWVSGRGWGAEADQ